MAKTRKKAKAPKKAKAAKKAKASRKSSAGKPKKRLLAKASQKPAVSRTLARILCPECGAEIVLGSTAQAGEIITCIDCGSELEVIKKGERLDVELVEEKGGGRLDLGSVDWEDFE